MIIFFILGLVIIGLGVYAKVHSDRMNKLCITKATVLAHQPAVKKIGQMEIPVEFGAMISLLVLFILIGKGVGMGHNREPGIGRSGYDLELNEKGYSIGSITMPEDERYYEYYYVPASEDETYAYNVTLYDYGVGVVTIFPMESNGKGLNQSFAFYMEYEDLKSVIKDGKEYDFEELAGTTQNPDTAQGNVDYQYLYYYDGKEHEGSGGYGVDSETFDSVVEHIKAAVPKNVWSAVKEEIKKYYE